MKLRRLLGVVLAVGLAAPASAQSVQEDVRCILLSGAFAKAAKDEEGKQLARATGAFYLGRVNGRVDAKTLTDTMRTESKAIDPKAAGAMMEACAAKLGQAQKSMNDLGRTLTPGR